MQTRKTLSSIVVEYLRKIYQAHPTHFENLFYSNLGVTSRLFGDALALDEAITPELQQAFLGQFASAQTLNQAKIAAEGFFNYITATPEWNEFWAEVTKTITCPHTQKNLLNRIAHAFAFKLLAKAQPDTKEQSEFVSKLDPIRTVSLSEVLVGYLDRIYQHYPQFFANLFCGTGERLFYDRFNCIDAATVKVLATVITPAMQKNCIDIFSPINPMLSVSLLHQIRDSAGVCFLSISLSTEWQEFWNTVTLNTVTSPQRQQALLNIIAGAFTFKALSLAIQTDKEYYEEKFSLPQRFYFPKLFLNDGDMENDSKFIAGLQKDIFHLLISSQLSYEDYFSYIKSQDEKNILFQYTEWKRCLKEILEEVRIKSQGEAACIALNEWLFKAVNKMKELDARHKDSLRNFCDLIFNYLETNYVSQPVLSSPQLHSAILLCAATRELAEHIKSKTFMTKFKFSCQTLEAQQSKLVKKTIVPPLRSSSILRSPSTPKIAKTTSIGNLQSIKNSSPRHEETSVLPDPVVVPSRSSSARKYSDSPTLFRRTTSILGLSSKLKKESPREQAGSPTP